MEQFGVLVRVPGRQCLRCRIEIWQTSEYEATTTELVWCQRMSMDVNGSVSSNVAGKSRTK